MGLVYSTDSREQQNIWNRGKLVNSQDKRGKRVIERETKERALKSWILERGK